jgi:hypothetical protein
LNKLSGYLLISLFLVSIGSGESKAPRRPYREHKIYFENTPNELNVYKLYGRFDGKTVFILGGIQGDEPGGVLSADLYPDLVLEKGNLIIIPRANFHSIILNKRGVNGDMNRRFDRQEPRDIDDKIVEIIKSLMAESDLFLNLHDGSGFYRETYIDALHNPNRYGQSIIADADVYIAGKDTLHLAKMAQQVLNGMNYKIENDEHTFRFFNTRTLEPNSPYSEQRKSATYFALTNYHIPAFGIETSKELQSLELKIRYHNYVINEFLKIMGVEPEHPAILFEPPRLIYLLLSINDMEPRIAENNSTITVNPGDRIKVAHIESNYGRGLSCDIIGLGSDQDFRKTFTISQSTSIIVRKDNRVIGEIKLALSSSPQLATTSEEGQLLIAVNGTPQKVKFGETLTVKRGDILQIKELILTNYPAAELKVNLKGFVPPSKLNLGEDRGHLINTRNLCWIKYSLNGEGKVYPIVVSQGEVEIGRVLVLIED